MTGPEHYLEAERLIENAYIHLGRIGAHDLACAQVHALLAVAAATAMRGASQNVAGAMATVDFTAWDAVCGVPES